MKDTEANCFTDLTVAQINRIIGFYKAKKDQSSLNPQFFGDDFAYCIYQNVHWVDVRYQKRPIDGLRLALQLCESSTLLHYPIIVDDDTNARRFLN